MLKRSFGLALFSAMTMATSSTTAPVDDPMLAHQFSKKGPWFEGWYTRVTDLERGVSFGVIATSALAGGERLKVEGPSGYAALILQIPDLKETVSFEAYPKITSIGNVEDDFIWSSHEHGRVSKLKTDVRIASDARVVIDVENRKPWDAKHPHAGPEGNLAVLPYLPLHWFVWSTGGVASYEIEFAYEGKTYRYKGRGYVHQEKNWGAVFPPHWMWAQAVNESAYFTLAGGDLKFGPLLKTRAYLVGYRSTRVNADFNPGQGVAVAYEENIDACNRRFEFASKNGQYRLEVEIEADEETFANLSIPTLHGYKPNGAVESFSALARTRIYENHGSTLRPEWHFIEEQEFKQAALEFGAAAMECQ